MERLTYDFALGGNHCWQVKGADNLECREVCERQGDDGCKTCPIAKAFDRLASYEETGLEPEEIIKLKGRMEREKVNKCSLFDIDFAEIIEDAFGIPVDRLRELAEADWLIGMTVYESNKRGFISTYEVISIHISKCSILVGWNLLDGVYSNLNGFEISALGKSIFLTREEAEAALAKEST